MSAHDGKMNQDGSVGPTQHKNCYLQMLGLERHLRTCGSARPRCHNITQLFSLPKFLANCDIKNPLYIALAAAFLDSGCKKGTRHYVRVDLQAAYALRRDMWRSCLQSLRLEYIIIS